MQRCPEKFIKIKKQEIMRMNQEYLDMLKIIIKQVKELKPEDRLDYASGLNKIIIALSGSIHGWETWCNVDNMCDIELKEFEEYFPKMKKMAIEWLEIDYKITKLKSKDLIRKFDEEYKNSEANNPLVS